MSAIRPVLIAEQCDEGHAVTKHCLYRLAYDGRGNAVVRSAAELEGAAARLGGYDHGLYAERWAPFVKARRMLHTISSGS